MISMHIVSFQKNSAFYNSYFKCIEQGILGIERITFSRYYVVNLEKCEIVFKRLASNCSGIYLIRRILKKVFRKKCIQLCMLVCICKSLTP